MSEDIRHARAVSPWFIDNKNGDGDDFHGLTDVGVDVTVGSENIYVVGKKAKCGTNKDTPEATLPLTQYERGEIDSYKILSNLSAEPSGGFDLLDFNSSLVDVVYYLKDEFNGTVDASVWMPKCTINSLTINADDPEGIITKDIELGSDNERVLLGDNKFLIHKEDTAPSGTSGNYDIDLSDPAPVEDPHNAGVYILRVDRIRSGTLTTLTTSDYTYTSGTTTLTITAGLTDDVYQIYYSASSFGSAGDPTTVDSASPCFLKAENITVLISDGTTEVEMDRLQSLTITATLNRIDEKVLGNDERVLREISDTPVTVDATARIKNWNGRKAFMNSLNSTDMVSNVKDFADNVRVTVKIYNNADKDTFLIGYQVDNLSLTDESLSFTANEFGTADFSAESDDILITTTEGDLT